MTAITVTGTLRRASVTERALLRLSVWLHAAAMAHAARRVARAEAFVQRCDVASDARVDARRAAVHTGLLPR